MIHLFWSTFTILQEVYNISNYWADVNMDETRTKSRFSFKNHRPICHLSPKDVANVFSYMGCERIS